MALRKYKTLLFFIFLTFFLFFFLRHLDYAKTAAPDEIPIPVIINEKQTNYTLLPSKEKLIRFAPNFNLWSQKAKLINWTYSEEMCKNLLQIPAKDVIDEENNQTIEEARNWTIPYVHTDKSINDLLSNCKRFRRLMNLPKRPLSEDEAHFPLAYVMVGARNAAQFVRLFRMIYQAQNAYCITYDDKGNEYFKSAVRKLAHCYADYGNVFLTPKPQAIYYTHTTILGSVTVCMELLLSKSHLIPWRYLQVVSWNDMPLRTNYEMVKIFKTFNGSQDCALDRLITGFFVFSHDTKGDQDVFVYRPVIPDGITMYKGSYATTMSHEFVQFLFTNPSSKKFYKWVMNGTKCAEEFYWTTMVHNLHLNPPGGFPGECLHFYALRGKVKPFISRYQIWTWASRACKGKLTSFSCVYGVEDVPTLITRPELIAHKMYEEFEPASMFCMEQWFWNRVANEEDTLDYSYYENLPSVRYHNMRDKDNFVC